MGPTTPPLTNSPTLLSPHSSPPSSTHSSPRSLTKRQGFISPSPPVTHNLFPPPLRSTSNDSIPSFNINIDRVSTPLSVPASPLSPSSPFPGFGFPFPTPGQGMTRSGSGLSIPFYFPGGEGSTPSVNEGCGEEVEYCATKKVEEEGGGLGIEMEPTSSSAGSSSLSFGTEDVPPSSAATSVTSQHEYEDEAIYDLYLPSHHQRRASEPGISLGASLSKPLPPLPSNYERRPSAPTLLSRPSTSPFFTLPSYHSSITPTRPLFEKRTFFSSPTPSINSPSPAIRLGNSREIGKENGRDKANEREREKEKEKGWSPSRPKSSKRFTKTPPKSARSLGSKRDGFYQHLVASTTSSTSFLPEEPIESSRLRGDEGGEGEGKEKKEELKLFIDQEGFRAITISLQLLPPSSSPSTSSNESISTDLHFPGTSTTNKAVKGAGEEGAMRWEPPKEKKEIWYPFTSSIWTRSPVLRRVTLPLALAIPLSTPSKSSDTKNPEEAREEDPFRRSRLKNAHKSSLSLDTFSSSPWRTSLPHHSPSPSSTHAITFRPHPSSSSSVVSGIEELEGIEGTENEEETQNEFDFLTKHARLSISKSGLYHAYDSKDPSSSSEGWWWCFVYQVSKRVTDIGSIRRGEKMMKPVVFLCSKSFLSVQRGRQETWTKSVRKVLSLSTGSRLIQIKPPSPSSEEEDSDDSVVEEEE